MKTVPILFLALILFIQSCKKENEHNPPINNYINCNTVFYSYAEDVIKFDTTAIIQSDSNYNIDSLVAKFQISIHASGKIDSGCFVSLTNLSLGNIIYLKWEFGDGGISEIENPTHKYFFEGNYNIKLIVLNNLGKSDTAMFSFNNRISPKLFFPNIFTPNNDGLNDLFRPYGIHIDTTSNNYTLTVKDKNNIIIFETHNFLKWFSEENIDFNKYKDGEKFYVEFSVKTTTGNNITGCTPLVMRLSEFTCSDTNLVFPDQIDERYGKIKFTNEVLCN